MADRTAPPALPARFRPFGVRAAAVVLGTVLVVTVGAIWLAFPAHIRAEFTTFQRLTVLAIGAAAFAVAYGLARCRVDADTDGLTVVNGYRVHRFTWSQVVAVSLRRGNPWAVLDLSDGTSQAVLGIQGSDGARAVQHTRRLRALVEAHAALEPPYPQPPSPEPPTEQDPEGEQGPGPAPGPDGSAGP